MSSTGHAHVSDVAEAEIVIMLTDIAPKDYGCVMISFDYNLATAAGFFSTDLLKAMGEFFLVSVGATRQLVCANVNMLLEPKPPPRHC